MHSLTYLSLEVDVCPLQNQLPHTVYVASVGGDHEECGAMLREEKDEQLRSHSRESLEDTLEKLASPR